MTANIVCNNKETGEDYLQEVEVLGTFNYKGFNFIVHKKDIKVFEEIKNVLAVSHYETGHGFISEYKFINGFCLEFWFSVEKCIKFAKQAINAIPAAKFYSRITETMEKYKINKTEDFKL